MDFLNIVYAVLSLGVMGLLFGLLLAYASKIFAVDTDPRLPQIEAALPGVNCGGCGYPGCSALASAIAEGKAPVNGCPVGGAECATKIAQIMGVNAAGAMKYVAHVSCRGGDNNVTQKFSYDGLTDCVAAQRVGGGQIACQYGCLGLGTCVKECPFDAIHVENGCAEVDADKCTSCGKCVDACPRNIISILPYNQDVSVACKSKEKGGALRDICKIGCIGCKICEKTCPSDAIHVVDNLAHIDYDKCTNCGLCAEKCPRKIITNASQMRPKQ